MNAEQPAAKTKSAQLYAAYRYSKATMDLVFYNPATPSQDLPADVEQKMSDDHTEALNAYLLHPAETALDFKTKMTVFRDEEIVDNWAQGAHIVATLCEDARRCIA